MPVKKDGKSDYTHYRVRPSKHFSRMRTVPWDHIRRDEQDWVKGRIKKRKIPEGTRVITGKFKASAPMDAGRRGKRVKALAWGVQSVLIPKKRKNPELVVENPVQGDVYRFDSQWGAQGFVVDMVSFRNRNWKEMMSDGISLSIGDPVQDGQEYGKARSLYPASVTIEIHYVDHFAAANWVNKIFAFADNQWRIEKDYIPEDPEGNPELVVENHEDDDDDDDLEENPSEARISLDFPSSRKAMEFAFFVEHLMKDQYGLDDVRDVPLDLVWEIKDNTLWMEIESFEFVDDPHMEEIVESLYSAYYNIY